MKHLFGPDEFELDDHEAALRRLLASDDPQKWIIYVKLADVYAFRVRSLSRTCRQYTEERDSRATEFSEKAHGAQAALAQAMHQALTAPPGKVPLLLFRLGLAQLHLARFEDAASSFRRIVEHDHPGEFLPLARVGHALALQRAGTEEEGQLAAIGPPGPGPLSPGSDREFVAFAVARCLKGEWAEQAGNEREARRAYHSFLSWVEGNPKAADHQDVSFLRIIRARADALEPANR
jgi:hypothetical protein